MPDKKLKIRYLKSYDFKVSLATGVYGGITTNGLINANFFSDRTVIPTSQIVEIDGQGNIISSVEEKDGDVVREVTVGLLMDVNSAKLLVNWLSSKIDEFEKIK